jgi:hypothetical protein
MKEYQTFLTLCITTKRYYRKILNIIIFIFLIFRLLILTRIMSKILQLIIWYIPNNKCSLFATILLLINFIASEPKRPEF